MAVRWCSARARRSEAAFELAREVARAVDMAMVLDADGLNAHAGRLDALAARSAPPC